MSYYYKPAQLCKKYCENKKNKKTCYNNCQNRQQYFECLDKCSNSHNPPPKPKFCDDNSFWAKLNPNCFAPYIQLPSIPSISKIRCTW